MQYIDEQMIESNPQDNESYIPQRTLQNRIQTSVSTKQFHSSDNNQLNKDKELQLEELKNFQQNTIFQKKNSTIDKRSKINKPGETKNLPKNVLGGLKRFIEIILEKNQIENILDYENNRYLQDLKNMPKSKQINKALLKRFLSTKMGNLFGKQYFGQCHWAQYFVRQNKTKTTLYYKHNLSYYRMTKQKEQQSQEDDEIYCCSPLNEYDFSV